jgi:hypothetical protein
MAGSISTTGVKQGPLDTDYVAPETNAEWRSRHDGAVRNATPDGDTLTTTWVSSSGPQSLETIREPGETDAEFLERHVKDYEERMREEPPLE